MVWSGLILLLSQTKPGLCVARLKQPKLHLNLLLFFAIRVLIKGRDIQGKSSITCFATKKAKYCQF